MENKSQQYKGFGRLAEPHIRVTRTQFNLDFSFEPKGDVYLFRYESKSPEILNFLSQHYEKIMGLNATKADQLFTITEKKELFSVIEDTVLSALLDAFKSFLGDPGALSEQGHQLSSGMLCLCTGITEDDFARSFRSKKGDVKAALMETNIMAFCDTCSARSKELMRRLESEESYFLGKPESEWTSKFEELMNDFYLFCPAEYSSLKFELKSLKHNKIVFMCDRQGQKVQRSDLQSTLHNYLQDEFSEDVVVSVIF